MIKLGYWQPIVYNFPLCIFKPPLCIFEPPLCTFEPPLTIFNSHPLLLLIFGSWASSKFYRKRSANWILHLIIQTWVLSIQFWILTTVLSVCLPVILENHSTLPNLHFILPKPHFVWGDFNSEVVIFGFILSTSSILVWAIYLIPHFSSLFWGRQFSPFYSLQRYQFFSRFRGYASWWSINICCRKISLLNGLNPCLFENRLYWNGSEST